MIFNFHFDDSAISLGWFSSLLPWKALGEREKQKARLAGAKRAGAEKYSADIISAGAV